MWNARDAQLSLVAEVTDAYVEMRALQQREAIARNEVAREHGYLAIAQHTSQARLLARSDFIRHRRCLTGRTPRLRLQRRSDQAIGRSSVWRIRRL